MRNKQEELEALAQSQSYDSVGRSETWWEEPCDWSAVMDGYRLFRRDRKGRRGQGVAPSVKEGLDCTGLGVGGDMVGSLWVQDVEPVLVELHEICMGLLLKPVKVLKHTEGYFLIQVLRDLTRKGVLLDLLFVNRDGLMGEGMIGGCLGHKDDDIVEFKIFGNMRKTVRRDATLDFGGAGFRLLKELLRPVLFSVFINDMDTGVECMVSKFANNTELGGTIDSLEGRQALQRDFNRSEC
ncbi:hypothetical protein GRJ2_003018700 [Grus japonensis]|uniref:Uncharacterized protein n=1 Tax=Grus japonensis TaxID=30415 RepID=A0ABC9Y7L9_GRUJA